MTSVLPRTLSGQIEKQFAHANDSGVRMAQERLGTRCCVSHSLCACPRRSPSNTRRRYLEHRPVMDQRPVPTSTVARLHPLPGLQISFDVVLGNDGLESRHAEGSATVTICRRLSPMPPPRGLHQSESSPPLSTMESLTTLGGSAIVTPLDLFSGRESSVRLVHCFGTVRPGPPLRIFRAVSQIVVVTERTRLSRASGSKTGSSIASSNLPSPLRASGAFTQLSTLQRAFDGPSCSPLGRAHWTATLSLCRTTLRTFALLHCADVSVISPPARTPRPTIIGRANSYGVGRSWSTIRGSTHPSWRRWSCSAQLKSRGFLGKQCSRRGPASMPLLISRRFGRSESTSPNLWRSMSISRNTRNRRPRLVPVSC